MSLMDILTISCILVIGLALFIIVIPLIYSHAAKPKKQRAAKSRPVTMEKKLTGLSHNSNMTLAFPPNESQPVQNPVSNDQQAYLDNPVPRHHLIPETLKQNRRFEVQN
jgi:hypothetical protein